MRLSVIVLFAASLVSALTAPKRNNDGQVPDCAVKCATDTDPSPCKSDDTACICLNVSYGKSIADCVQQNCSADDVAKATDFGKAVCKDAGVDLDNPIPACAVECEQKAPTGSCGTDDSPETGKCLCENDDFIKFIVKCTVDSCSEEETKTAAFVGEALCRAYGVDISSTVGGY
ncbi:hypothetical protein FRC04_001570 [Tulasnella sp. 424]|nr:hypothetical protein FRC04_001570 [Tulasnella sp. 424]